MTVPAPIRVLIVEDSPVMQLFLEEIIAADSRLKIVATVSSGEKALQFLSCHTVDVISMDIQLPGINGLETTRQIMQHYPTPIVVVSSQLESDELNLSFNALKAGALSVLGKPMGMAHPEHEQTVRQLCTQLVIMSQVKVIRQRLFKPPPASVPAKVMAISPPIGNFQVLGIAASTGGPKALSLFFNQLDLFPLPILLVQHIAAHFLDGFAKWLESVTPFRVVIATDGEIPLPQHIYLAPEGRHLCFKHGKLSLNGSDPVSYQCPSATVLFQSLAESLGPKAIGMILTGMGDDGAAGLLAMRQAGAYTLAEAESTAVVYGMPAAADKLGAVCHMLPLTDLAPHLHFLVKKRDGRLLKNNERT